MSSYSLPNELSQTYACLLPSPTASSDRIKESSFALSLDKMSSLYPDSEFSLTKPSIARDLTLIDSTLISTNEFIIEEYHIKKEYIKNQIRRLILKKLQDSIENIDYECKEEGFGAVSDQAKENAKHILNIVYKKFPEYEYHIYPTEDREIAFDCNPQKGKGALILFDSKGGVACFSTLDGRNSRFRCDDIMDFSYDYLWRIFKQFDRNAITEKLNQPLQKQIHIMPILHCLKV